MHESGIAVFKSPLTIIPLSIDGTTPPGFMGKIQSKKINPGSVGEDAVLPVILKDHGGYLIDQWVSSFVSANSYAVARARLDRLKPFLGNATDKQMAQILIGAEQNDQVWYPMETRLFVRQLFKSHGHLLPANVQASLADKLNS